MTVTESKALSLIANAELAAKIPALGGLHQSYLQTKSALSKKLGCGNCSDSEPEFAALKSQAVLRIRTLPDVEMTKLKNHLVVKRLVFYVHKGGNREKVVR